MCVIQGRPIQRLHMWKLFFQINMIICSTSKIYICKPHFRTPCIKGKWPLILLLFSNIWSSSQLVHPRPKCPEHLISSFLSDPTIKISETSRPKIPNCLTSVIPSPSPNHKYPKHLLHIFITSKRIQYAKAPNFHIPKATAHKYNA